MEFNEQQKIAMQLKSSFIQSILIALICILQPTDFLSQQVDKKNDDSHAFLDKSLWSMSSRSFFMNTLNRGDAKDDYALAQGVGFALNSMVFHGFSFKASTYFIFNLSSSDLAERDKKSNALNRYEIGQFDITDRANKRYLNRLEEFYLQYSGTSSNLKLGRFILETPFINMQDGRMRPTVEEGIWGMKDLASNKVKVQGGVLWGISPRSTVKWYDLAESIGLYAPGNQINGSSAIYKFDGKSKILWMLNPQISLTPNAKLSYWNLWFAGVMNTSLIELNLKRKLNTSELYFNSMWIYQASLDNSSSIHANNLYFQKGDQANVWSSQLGLKNTHWNWNVNYTRIFNGGRYLMPREWGRDPFYTFMPRERNEGLADVNAITAQCSRLIDNGVKLQAGIGYYRLPSVSNFNENKYAMPTYGQANLALVCPLKGAWQNAEVKLLIAAKKEMSSEDLLPKHIYNKVEMINSNIVFDYKF